MPSALHSSSSDADLLKACIATDRRAQRLLYDRYTDKLFTVALRYLRHRQTAEDILAEAWIKAFTKLRSFSGSGSLEGWLKRIVTNEALMHLRKDRISFSELTPLSLKPDTTPAPLPESLELETVFALLNQLPDGCRTVFNLYEIEGYKHREIADHLDISINTSKSQLILAKKKLREAYTVLAAQEGKNLRPIPSPKRSL